MPDQDEQISHAREVKRRHEEELLAHPGVTGVGIGWRYKGEVMTDEVCIVVMVQEKLAPDDLDPDDVLPAEIEGVPVDVQQSGDLTAG